MKIIKWHPYEQAYTTHNHPTRFWETQVFAEDGTIMATSHGASEEEANKTAALVAAAPEMLAVLKSFVDDDPCAPNDPRRTAAIEAIRKAVGAQ